MIFNTFLSLGALVGLVQAGNIKRAENVIGGVLAGGYVNNITVSADNVIQCSEATISWTGTTGAVSLTIGQGGYYVGRTDLETIDSLSTNSYEWKVNQEQGKDLIFEVKDSKGTINYIQNVIVGKSDDSSCLSGSSPSSSSSSSSDGQSTSVEKAQSASVVELTTTSAAPPETSSSSESTSSSRSKSKTSSTSTLSTTPAAESTSTAVPTTVSLTSSPASPTNVVAASASSSGASNAPLAAASEGNSTSNAATQFKLSLGLGLGVFGALVGGFLV